MQRIKKDDRVMVITGRDAGTVGRVLRVFIEEDKVIVEGAAFVKRHERIRMTRRGAQEGGIVEREAKIQISNVQPICPGCGKAVRVGFKETVEGDRRSKMRVCRNCETTF